MIEGVEGTDLTDIGSEGMGMVFSGRAAVDFCVEKFHLQDRAPAIELMTGLLKTSVIFPVLETPSEKFLDAFTAFYTFAD